MTRITVALPGDVCTFMTKSNSVLLRIRNISEKIVEKIKIQFFFPIIFFSENCAVD